MKFINFVSSKGVPKFERDISCRFIKRKKKKKK